MRLGLKFFHTAFAFALVASTDAYAVTTTIPPNQTATVTLNAGDTLNVQAGGTLIVPATNAVSLAAGNGAYNINNFAGGTIQTNTNGVNTITAVGGVLGTIAIGNFGTINANGAAGNNAINLSASPASMTMTHSGAITGAVLFPNGVSNLTLNGGTIAGAVTGAGANSTINVDNSFTTGGTISAIGNLNINNGTFQVSNPVSATNFAVNTSGTVQLNNGGSITGTPFLLNGTLNVLSTGTVNSAITSTSAASALNVGSGATAITFSPANAISNVKTITVFAANTFSPTTAPTGFTLFTNAGTSNFISPLTLPTNATFNNTGTLNMNGNGIVCGSGSILNINNFATAGSTIVANGGPYSINVQTGTFIIQDAVTGFSNFNIAGGATTSLNTGLNMSSATLVATGALLTNGQTITGNTASVLTLASNFTNDGAINGVGTINVNGGTYTMNVSPTAFTQFNIAAAGTLAMNTGFVVPANAILTNAGTFNFNGRGLAMGSGASLIVAGGTVTANGAITNSVPNTAYTVAVNSGNFNLSAPMTGYSTFTIGSAGTATLGATLTIPAGASVIDNGAFATNGNAITGTPTSILTLANSFTTAGAITDVGIINVNANTFTMAAAPTGFLQFNIATAGTVIMNAPLAVPAGAALNDSGNLTTNGNGISGTATSIFNINSAFSTDVSTVSGFGTVNVNNNGSATFTTIPSNLATVNVFSGGTLALNYAPTVNTNGITNLNLNGGTIRLTSNYVIPTNGTLTLSSGIFNQGANSILGKGNTTFTLNTNFTQGSGSIGTTTAPISTLAVNAGTFTTGGSITANVIAIAAPATMSLGANLVLPTNGTLNDSGTLTMNGNSISTAFGSNTTLNINNNFSSTGAITNISTINSNAGTFTVGAPLTGFNAFNIASPATVILDADLNVGTATIAATLTNAGTLDLSGSSLLMAGNSTLSTTGTVLASGPISLVGGSGYSINVNNGGVLTVTDAISGYTSLAVATGGTVNLNPDGSLSNSIGLTNGTLNLNGGTLTGNITGAGIVNVNNDFTPPGTITASTININNGGSLDATNGVTATNWNVNSGGSLFANSNIVGNLFLNSGGSFSPIADDVTQVSGNYSQAGILNIPIIDTFQYSQVQVLGNTTLNGGNVQVSLPNGGINIANNDVFDIVTSTGPITLKTLPTVTAPPSLTLQFKSQVVGNNLQLVAIRTPLSLANVNPAYTGVAGALDKAVDSGNIGGLGPILKVLEAQATQAGLQQVLSELVTDESLNGGPIFASLQSIRLPLEEVFRRTQLLRAGIDNFKTGYSAGEMSDGKSSYGPMVFGNTMKQNAKNGVSGYTAVTGGFGLLGDTPVNEYFRVGIAGSYAGSTVRRNDITGNTTSIMSLQGFLYGTAEYGPLFADGALSIGTNLYRGKRNILQLNETAAANYRASQYGGKIRGGFSIQLGDSFEASPIASMQYLHLNRGSYTETGAPSANLRVSSRQLSALQVGLGGRIADVTNPDEFLPEIHVFYTHDVKIPFLQVTSQFVDGGGAFVSNGPLPPRSGVNAGFSITALMVEGFLLTAGYDLEAKKGFTSNSASIKFRWLF